MEKLSPRQKEIFDFIARYVTENGFCPSLADVAQGVGMHNSTAMAHINALKKKGYIVSEYKVARSLRTVDPEKVREKPVSESGANVQQGEAFTAPTVSADDRRKRRPLLVLRGDYAGNNDL